MNFTETIDYLNRLGHETLSMKLGLESISKLARELGNPQAGYPAIHIAGTNGKGSTAAMIAAIAEAAGRRVGLYTSPHLVKITERIRLNGEDISECDFARLASVVRASSESLVAKAFLGTLPTFFEQVTMIGFLFLREKNVDLAVIEVGLGGRLDATNICNPVVTAITPIAGDHQQYLGKTLQSIAVEKAGIIKPGIPVVSARQGPEAMEVIRERSSQLKAPLNVVGDLSGLPECDDDGFYRINDIRLNLRGRHQVENALAAIQIAKQLDNLGVEIGPEAISMGLGRVYWPGRLELIRTKEGRRVLLDGAHNPHGALALRAFLDQQFKQDDVTLIFGAMSDKALEEMADILFPAAKTVIATRIDNPRAVQPEIIEKLAVAAQRQSCCADTADNALERAQTLTAGDDLICVAGSLYLIGEIRGLLKG